MALVRDPLFWKRFSRAVHLDEEAKAAAQNRSLVHSDNWIQAQYRKKRRSISSCGSTRTTGYKTIAVGDRKDEWSQINVQSPA
ncbi:conserved hypothetical protein [Aspergillus udagawae]|uniref:Uncharacterized protein n=1 Tax=Aspergillus udagawae TaxID=91492 RepID=A0ABQ1AYH6_9EURO|nr:conserved hypothetical protein [Aspergillus udagawae]GFF90403.1 conserved hypothetical protein [Aspergillus udagawae]GFG04247.1 conserved hypothetical protein [Aspergillus udagawae]GFG20821.1 conserved hypothetical protein [Aspergillus udagawae]